MSDEAGLRLEERDDGWALVGSAASRFGLVDEYLAHLVDRQAAVSGAGDVPVGGAYADARKCERIAAVGLSLVFLVPLRQVTRRQAARPADRASSRRGTGSSG
ncbi:MAG TPA: hypothetical protein VJT49_28755 [Amycolatopsis sp.]|nr:hypothetical protein [Amycolatopsis sp.]HKS49029.1 hypothetical protein [Amycolatopsis sp.]